MSKFSSFRFNYPPFGLPHRGLKSGKPLTPEDVVNPGWRGRGLSQFRPENMHNLITVKTLLSKNLNLVLNIRHRASGFPPRTALLRQKILFRSALLESVVILEERTPVGIIAKIKVLNKSKLRMNSRFNLLILPN
jgi:hypothetical protein